MTESHQQIESACIRVVLDAVHFVDSRQFDCFARCFSQRGSLYRPGNSVPLQGHKAIVDAYESRPASRVTRHICSNMRVDIHSTISATVHSYVQLYAKDTAADGPDEQPALKIGEFEDACVLENGEWRISERKARFVL